MKSFNLFQLSPKVQNNLKKKIFKELNQRGLNLRKLTYNLNNYHPDLRENLELCLQIENIFKPYIFKNFPKKYHNNLSLQFPINIRFTILPKKIDMLHDYSTNILHTDIWSGAPEDIRNFIYYLKVSNTSSYCKIFNGIKKNKDLKDYRGKYLNAPKITNLKEIKYKKKNGLLLSFDPFCPHYTFYPDNCRDLRISLDFRVKLSSPYLENGKLMKKEKFINSKIGQPALGYYWIMSKRKFKTIDEKIKEEFVISKKIDDKAVKLRKAYLRAKKEYRNYI